MSLMFATASERLAMAAAASQHQHQHQQQALGQGVQLVASHPSAISTMASPQQQAHLQHSQHAQHAVHHPTFSNLAAAMDLEHTVTIPDHHSHTQHQTPPSLEDPHHQPASPTTTTTTTTTPSRVPAMERFHRVCKACLSENLSPDKLKTICNNDGCQIQGQLQPRTYRLKCKLCGTLCHNSPRGDLYYRNHLAKEHPELGYERVVEQPRKRKASPDSGIPLTSQPTMSAPNSPETADPRTALQLVSRKVQVLQTKLSQKERMEEETKKWHAEEIADIRQQALSAELRHQQEMEELRQRMQAEIRRLHEKMEEQRRQHHRALERQQQEIEALRRDKEVVERQLEAELERADAAFDERLNMLSGGT
ncbi:hypothetical protein HDV00_007723 [Rhizophlyctis rosea]|nr:hypothetical protein HDV00_007723 [Rhizophlyctis rosea]